MFSTPPLADDGIMARYGSYLPITEETPRLSLGEGGTPLVFASHLSEMLDIALYLKLEGLNPTGSFKDRGMVVAVAKALEAGSHAIICASTGNTSASAAAYAARAGIRAVVVVPQGKIAVGKLAQAFLYGAEVVQIDGNFDEGLGIVRALADALGMTIVNSINPHRLEGQKTAAFEIVDVLGRAPDVLAVPVGNAGNISAYWKGFTEYLPQDARRPRMLGFEAEGAAAIVRGAPIEHPETIATAIRIGNPASWSLAVSAARDSGGFIDAVSDDEIRKAYRLLAAREGVFVEPASAASVAGVIKSARDGRIARGETVVAVLTGHGLKDPDIAFQEAEARVVTLPADLRAIERHLLLSVEGEKMTADERSRMTAERAENRAVTIMDPIISPSPGSSSTAEWTVRVPASSANIGSGFDTLGLAVDLYLTVRAVFDPGRPGDLKVHVMRGDASIPRDAGNLIYRALCAAFAAAHEEVPGVLLAVDSPIPAGSGLGSSAAAIVAGLVLAQSVLGPRCRKAECLRLATSMEGHPDNVAASFYGGLVAAWRDAAAGDVVVRTIRRDVPLKLLALIPPEPLATERARSALPDAYARADVVDALGKLALIIAAFQDGDFFELRRLLADRLHQPYRFPLIAGADEVLHRAADPRCLGVYLSGAGPTLMALFADEAARESWERDIRTLLDALGWRAMRIAPSPVGAVVETPEGRTIPW